MKKLARFFVLPLLMLPLPSAAIASSPDQERLDQAKKLLIAMNHVKTIQTMQEMMTAQLTKDRPQLREPLEHLYKTYLNPKTLEPIVAEIYARNYTKGELSDLADFYNSPTGRKSLELQPKIAAESMQAVQLIFHAHEDELKKAFEDAQKKQSK